ncbi:MAG: D-alanine--D-alanine ligase [Deltaproteobacteria bacterium]|nr:D-alanine--D-alanine ligase [Deltaproteobacteria bacterium]
MRKLAVALLSGGISSEREVSLEGGNQVYEALDKKKYAIARYDPKTDLVKLAADADHIDFALIILHGPYGEDGTVQGMLDLLGIPYQGSGVTGSALAMNKLTAKQIYERSGIPVPSYIAMRKGDRLNPDDVVKRLSLPLVIKPVSCGSSVGMSIVKSKEDLQGAVDKAFSHDSCILIETYIEGVELTGSIIGNDTLEALPIIEIIPDESHDFFDYEAKYTPGLTQEICPARIDEAMTEKAQTYAKLAHSALFCKGYSRTDMILSGKDIYILETNTIPGMASTSLLPLAAKTAGISFTRLLDRLIELGMEAHQRGER